MAWSFSGDKPIFMQLVDRINLDIISRLSTKVLEKFRR